MQHAHAEMGDKTFFIALLLALKEDKRFVFIGTFGALAVMTVISVLLGQVGRKGDTGHEAGCTGPVTGRDAPLHQEGAHHFHSELLGLQLG